MTDNEEVVYKNIRRNIKKYRKKRHLTSAQLANMLDMSHDYIRQIQIVDSNYTFSVITLYKIASILDVTIDELINDKNYTSVI